MKAAVFTGVEQHLQIHEVAMPEAAPGMLVFKVNACGICASDLHAAEIPHLLEPGVILGHEYTGEVVAIGEGVSGWQPGDRLIALPGKPCGECDACAGGHFMDCSEIVMQGFDVQMQGAYAQYSTCVAAMATKLPDEVTDLDAATIEPMAVGLNAWRAAQPVTGDSVMVVGAGIIGLAVAKWARFFGALNVGVSERVPARRQRALQSAADLVIDPDSVSDPVAEDKGLTGRQPSVIFECVGRPILQSLIEVAPANAHLVLVGTSMQEERFTALSAARKRLRMTFTLGYEPEDFSFTLAMLGAGRIVTDSLVTDTISLEQVPQTFAMLSQPNEHCKVLIRPWG